MRNRTEDQIEIHLTLIRHGATLSNKEGRYLGKTDEALSPDGIRTLEKSCIRGRLLSVSRNGQRWISVRLRDIIIRNFPEIRHIRDGSTAEVPCRFRKERAGKSLSAEVLPDTKKWYIT